MAIIIITQMFKHQRVLISFTVLVAEHKTKKIEGQKSIAILI